MPYPAKLNPEQILDAAQALLETSGPDGLSMRTLADSLEVRPSSLYRHHASRETLLLALGERAALALQEALTRAAARKKSRVGAEAASHAYLDYARQHPHLYALLLLKLDQLPQGERMGHAGKQLWNTLLDVVGALSGNPDDTARAVALWTFLHGFVELERSGLFGASGPRGGLEVGLTALLDAMAAAHPGRNPSS
ncbi:TetR/AcrR family transcriptional regulator [Deinococcus frigens]|uniref:TetR/AcrR family transcriptional regulator n=1 Tax=Deinococcus frigens TaxID=249403 RepID=UPI0004966774|nr:TetR/AcrR family transcriptional regulator [Deinococcus frigens]